MSFKRRRAQENECQKKGQRSSGRVREESEMERPTENLSRTEGREQEKERKENRKEY